MSNLMPMERIEDKIFLIRGQKAMVDRDLAYLYEVPTKRLNEQVRRNIERFPDDFMFQLTIIEKEQLVANCDRFSALKHSTSLPYAFTEQGIAMLSSVLRSEKAVQVNIAIMRAFVKLRRILSTHKELAQKIKELEQRMDKYDGKVQGIFDAIKKMMEPEVKPKRIGFLR